MVEVSYRFDRHDLSIKQFISSKNLTTCSYVISLTVDEETRFFESSKSVLGAFKIGACVCACIRELSSN